MPTYFGSDGATLHYDELTQAGADRPPVVALAGGAAMHPRYLGDLAGLGDAQRLILPHLRGVGRTPLPDSVQTASFWRQAEDVEQLRLHLGLDRLLLLGHSAGTRLAISYAARFPDRLAGLVLVTPPAGYLVDEPSDTPALIDARRGDPVFDAAVAGWATGPGSHDDAGFNAWYQQVAPLGYAAWGERERDHASTALYCFAANRAYFSVEPPADLASRLAEVLAPVLVVAGAQDCSAGLAPVRALSALFPAGELAVIDGCGHHPWVEQPAAFRTALDAFLRPLS
ncbi:alpha/beta fold hydrolase [Catellatospora chokoriensis]|uniref:Hydrolase n=1 Tax=Catellatospora chokoriensis TaxID=310353 RepID=A0A8J3NUT4_9ACTN|nr:alpha/beta hydrolase [Catellatospora chokoriensis]GIF93221.1 hydrolase [Catellatospora chokoriensis]